MALKQMRYFLAVLRAGSFTRAAQALHMAQTAIGMQIHNLETELGVELLIRHSRGVTPTGAGEVLAEHAARIVAKVERMRLDIMDMGGEPRGRIALGLTGAALREIRGQYTYFYPVFSQQNSGINKYTVPGYCRS